MFPNSQRIPKKMDFTHQTNIQLNKQTNEQKAMKIMRCRTADVRSTDGRNVIASPFMIYSVTIYIQYVSVMDATW